MDAVQCRDCVGGAIHTGKPTGVQIQFHGLPAYVTRPDEGTPGKGIIIFITDIFGWKFPNSRLLADKFAKNGGYTVYIPDFMRGQSILPHLSLRVFTLDRQATELLQTLPNACASPPPMKRLPRFSTASSSSHSWSSKLSSSLPAQLSIPDDLKPNRSSSTS